MRRPTARSSPRTRSSPPAPELPRVVALVGAMGSGKTTVGALLAQRLGRPFVDNDVALEQRAGRTAAQVEARDGLDVLHRMEAEVLRAALTRRGPAVIAAAASAITDPAVRADLVRDAYVVWLRARPDTLVARLSAAAPTTRPLRDVDPAALVAAQASERDALFASVADTVADTDDVDAASLVGDLVTRLRRG